MTTTEINLKNWCGDAHYRLCDSPWALGGWLYATDTFKAIRLPTDQPDSVPPEGKKFVRASEIFIPQDGPWEPWPAIDGMKTGIADCPTCDGSKLVEQEKCRECDGSGEVECFHCYNVDECDECDGEGVTGGKPCPTCNATGQMDQPLRIKVGSVWIAAKQDAVVRELPNPVFCCGKNETYIRFDGGEAVVMGLSGYDS